MRRKHVLSSSAYRMVGIPSSVLRASTLLRFQDTTLPRNASNAQRPQTSPNRHYPTTMLSLKHPRGLRRWLRRPRAKYSKMPSSERSAKDDRSFAPRTESTDHLPAAGRLSLTDAPCASHRWGSFSRRRVTEELATPFPGRTGKAGRTG